MNIATDKNTKSDYRIVNRQLPLQPLQIQNDTLLDMNTNSDTSSNTNISSNSSSNNNFNNGNLANNPNNSINLDLSPHNYHQVLKTPPILSQLPH